MSKKQSSTPHDALFKLFLRQPDTARDFLAFHLPAPIHALCDGWIVSPIPTWQGSFMPAHFR